MKRYRKNRMSINSSILESKLKRYKISYSNENGKIVIGKPENDYGNLIGLVVVPIISGIGISIYMIMSKIYLMGVNSGKIIAGILFLIGTGLFNLSRIKTRRQSNYNIKTIDGKKIKVENEFGKYVFDSKDIKHFEYTAEQIDEETYEGNLYLVDNEERKHQILGFDDENEKYVLNDLKWFSEYLIKITTN